MVVFKYILSIALAGLLLANAAFAQQDHATPQPVEQQPQPTLFSTNTTDNNDNQKSKDNNTSITGIAVSQAQGVGDSTSSGGNANPIHGIGTTYAQQTMYEAVTGDLNQFGVGTSGGNNTSYGVLSGQVFVDDNQNCQHDANEGLNGSVIIQATDAISGHTYNIIVDSAGQYSKNLPLGSTYQLQLQLSNPYVDTSCQANYTVQLNSTQTQATRNFALRTLERCPFMQVNLDVPIIQSCYPTVCTVQYCNQGTDTAYQAYVEVAIDTNLVLDSASIPAVYLGNGIYSFDLGTVVEQHCGQFQVHLHTPCDTSLLGQEHCIEANIFPDTSCETAWDGTILDIDALCANGMISFAVGNTGKMMPAQVAYIVIQDDLMIQQGGIVVKQGVFQLGSGQSINISHPYQAGADYRLRLLDASGNGSLAMNVLLEIPLHNSAEGVENEGTYYYNNGTFYNSITDMFSAQECLTNGNYSGFMGKTDDDHTTSSTSEATTAEGLNPVDVTIFPMPVEQVAQVRIEGNLPTQAVNQFRLFDLMGREVLQQRINGYRFSFDRQDLAAGWYFYKVEANGKILNTGKIIMK